MDVHGEFHAFTERGIFLVHELKNDIALRISEVPNLQKFPAVTENLFHNNSKSPHLDSNMQSFGQVVWDTPSLIHALQPILHHQKLEDVFPNVPKHVLDSVISFAVDGHSALQEFDILRYTKPFQGFPITLLTSLSL